MIMSMDIAEDVLSVDNSFVFVRAIYELCRTSAIYGLWGFMGIRINGIYKKSTLSILIPINPHNP